MIASVAEALALGPDELGESIGWEATTKELWRVDVRRGLVHQVESPLSACPSERTERFGGEVGFALPRLSGGMVVGEELRLWLVDQNGSRRVLLELEESNHNRWNDAICDARGRLWAGTIARDGKVGSAGLYRVDPDGAVERLLDGITISNGLGWLEEGARLHFIDSPTQRIDVFDVDLVTGRPSGRRTLVEIDENLGMPDGLCVDDQDGTWVALFGGGRVRRYDRDGQLEDEVEVQAPHVTNVCLGGAEASELFVTTARHKLSPAQRQQWPAAGLVFHLPVDRSGVPLLAFGG